jgi:hypothetical protein
MVQVKHYYSRGETNHEFAMGLDMGFGITFPYIQQDLRTVVFDKADNNNEFAYGLGIYTAFSLHLYLMICRKISLRLCLCN